MDTKDTIIKLRKDANLSQEEMAQELFVTRQAVSRWENGETIPNVDTLKLMSLKFGISINTLLGTPFICHSCGMSLQNESDRGTNEDGSKSEDFCTYCYADGSFTAELTMEEAIEHNLKYLDEWNKGAGLNLTPEEARTQLKEFFPKLARWAYSE